MKKQNRERLNGDKSQFFVKKYTINKIDGTRKSNKLYIFTKEDIFKNIFIFESNKLGY